MGEHQGKPVYQLEAHIARNGRFYGFCAIRRCNNPHFKAWYIVMLIPGGWDHADLTGAVTSYSEAKARARKICERVIADLQGITLI